MSPADRRNGRIRERATGLEPATSSLGSGRSTVVVDNDLTARRNRLAGQHPSLLDLVGVQGVVHAHRDLSLREVGHAGPAVSRLTGERRIETRTPCGVEKGVAGLVPDAALPAFEPD